MFEFEAVDGAVSAGLWRGSASVGDLLTSSDRL